MSSSDLENETSNDSFDLETRSYTPHCDEISMLLSQVPYITNQSMFLDKLESPYTLSSGDLILGVCGFARYDNAKKSLGKRIKKAINSMIASASVEPSEGIAVFFCPRIVNAPLREVYEMYSKVYAEVGTAFGYFILISRLYTPGKTEYMELVATFEEFAEEDLKTFPYCSEEVLLLPCRTKRNTEIDGVPFRIFLAKKQEFENFLSNFMRETSGQ